MSQTAGSERISIEGPAGKLEGLWLPAGDTLATRAVVLCHPHPLYGGSMETKLVARTARRLGEDGHQTLRFNFRGVGRSEGTWDDGRGERDDLVCALDYAARRMPNARLALFGFSFGAAMGLDVGSTDERVDALIAVAPPASRLPSDWSLKRNTPTLVVGASRDEVVDPQDLERWALELGEYVRFEMVSNADHLFTDQTGLVADAAARFLSQLV